MKRGATTWLVGFDMLLLCWLAWLWVDPRGGLRAIHWQPPTAIKPELGSLSGIATGREDTDVARFMMILDRPIFSPTRRAFISAKSTTPPPPNPLDSIHLYGLFQGSEGGGVIARVEGKTRRIKLTEAIGDWVLKEIRSREVVFSMGAESRVVPLVQARQAQGAAQAQPAIPVYASPVPAASVNAPAAQTLPAQAAGTKAEPVTAEKISPLFVIGGGRP
jgi:hypothetical protein